MSWRAFGETTVTLVVIMDPLGNAPVFVAATHDWRPHDVRRLAVSAAAAAATLIIGFALGGEVLLRYLNVSVDALSIAGGLLLGLVALELLRGKGAGVEAVEAAPLLVTLATPLLAGPGAIATAMVLSRRYAEGTGRVAVLAGIMAAAAVVGTSLILAERIARVLPAAVLAIVTQVMGLLLAAIAVQLVSDGVVAIAASSP